ncbi:unnamed protein product [Trichobilharzia szidati]|nr:unnamed protein product [Trichobilharzia szidati]
MNGVKIDYILFYIIFICVHFEGKEKLVDQSKSNHATSTEPAPISSRSDSVSRTEHEAVLRELEMSKSSLRALQTQLEEQTRNAREQIDSLMEDRKAMQEEADSLRKRNEEKARVSSEQLKRCQELLYDSTKEFLAQRNQFRQAEKVWIAEKDKLLSQISTKKFNSTGISASTLSVMKTDGRNLTDPLADRINHNHNNYTNPMDLLNNTNIQSLESRAWAEVNQQKQIQLEKTIQNLENQLDQQQKLSDMYRDQVIQLEEELVRVREEGVLSKDLFKDQAHKLHERVQVMSQRYQNLERRRQLEMEGYRTDISTLRKKLKEVERQLLKLTLGFTDGIDLPESINGNNNKDIDIALLKQVKASTTRSNQIMNELKNLKLKMYSLEDELRKI